MFQCNFCSNVSDFLFKERASCTGCCTGRERLQMRFLSCIFWHICLFPSPQSLKLLRTSEFLPYVVFLQSPEFEVLKAMNTSAVEAGVVDKTLTVRGCGGRAGSTSSDMWLKSENSFLSRMNQRIYLIILLRLNNLDWTDWRLRVLVQIWIILNSCKLLLFKNVICNTTKPQPRIAFTHMNIFSTSYIFSVLTEQCTVTLRYSNRIFL